jgi:hypothetical protein
MSTITSLPAYFCINTIEMISTLSFQDFCYWLSRPIYDIETRKLCSKKGI